MPLGRKGAIFQFAGGPYWKYELDGRASIFDYESAEEALEELQRKLNSRQRYVPRDCPNSTPLLISFHGAGREGESEISRWEEVAEKDNILLLAPTSVSRELFWGGSSGDLEKFQQELNWALHNWPVDRNRIYIAGHSAGGHYALDLGFNNPNLFASVAAHSPWMATRFLNASFPPGTRRIPTCIWVGDHDENRDAGVTLERGLRELRGVSIELKILANHRHRDYHKRQGLAEEMWDFLKCHQS